MLSFIYKSLNRLLPFATPGTPLTTDLVHLAVLCGLLYFAPQIQTYLNTTFRKPESSENDGSAQDTPTAAENDRRRATAQHIPNAAPIEAQLGPANHAPPPPPPQIANPPPEAHDEPPPPPPPLDPGPADGAPGPANPRPVPTTTTRTREVGAKKAKSLARRDQRRAYNEFMRSQGEAQRARDAEGAAEREAGLAEERARRAAVEAELREEERRERDERKEKERRREAEEGRARVVVGGLVRDGLVERGWVDLGEVAGRVGRGREWVEMLVRAEGMLGEREGEVVMVTGKGWLVRIAAEMMREVWRVLEARVNVTGVDSIGLDEIGSVLEGVIRGGGQRGSDMMTTSGAA
ncbi:hypothetical protein CAC42_7009 [Sphaceloma murrayae]|uniref:Uncharacterized protein n=1 Tax=Sphaceloma murrayae TaxID=2082308 RepID=A0A2K1QQF3_9PEZI|nr:hypothetical protein CAC42_7009 [Sphaceloma murrayae]